MVPQWSQVSIGLDRELLLGKVAVHYCIPRDQYMIGTWAAAGWVFPPKLILIYLPL